MTSQTFENASTALPVLLDKVLTEGKLVESRNGTTRELTMQQITLLNPFPAEITTPGRRVSLPAQIAETMWILQGRNDVDWLSNYLPRAKEFSDDGKTWRGGYGPRLRKWAINDGKHQDLYVDQFEHVVSLLIADPETRRAVMAIYDPAIDTAPGKDIPCNNWIHFLPRDGVLHAHIAIRSNDLMWGWSGINAFEWSSILHVVAGLAGMKSGSVTFSISSLHLYERHFKKAARIVDESAAHTPIKFHPNPAFSPVGLDARNPVGGFDNLVERWFHIEAIIRKGGGQNPGALSHIIDQFPEPMLRSWLVVLHAWHTGEDRLAAPLFGTSLYEALNASPKKSDPTEPTPIATVSRAVPAEGSFAEFVSGLHAEKHASYGDSWKKRGEMLGIMANLARKIDRLGVTGGGDTAADTAIDLLCYSIKYRLWLSEEAGAPRSAVVPAEGLLTSGREHADNLTAMLMEALGMTGSRLVFRSDENLIEALRATFGDLEAQVMDGNPDRWLLVAEMIRLSAPLAQRCWEAEGLADKVAAAKADWHAGNADRSFNGYADV